MVERNKILLKCNIKLSMGFFGLLNMKKYQNIKIQNNRS